MKKIVIKKRKVDEEAAGVPSVSIPANSVGGGQIAGMGIAQTGKPSNWSEPGVSPKNQGKHRKRAASSGNPVQAFMRRSVPKVVQEGEEVRKGKFAGHDTFIVPSDLFHEARNQKKKGKHWKTYVGDGPHGKAIRQHARSNYGKPIILQDERTGAMCYASYGNKKHSSLDEAIFLSDIGKKVKFNPSTDKNIDQLSKRTLVGPAGPGHSIYHGIARDGVHEYNVVHNKTGKVTGTISGSRRRGVFTIDSTDSSGKGPKMHSVYRRILASGHAKALVGISHSPGGQKIWQKLSKHKDVNVHGWHQGKPVNLDPRDPEETHAGYEIGDQEERNIRNTKLVAAYGKNVKPKPDKKR